MLRYFKRIGLKEDDDIVPKLELEKVRLLLKEREVLLQVGPELLEP